MEKIRFFTLTFIVIIVLLFVFTLTKSFLNFNYDQGIELKEEEAVLAENLSKDEDWNALKENSKLIWERFLVYPTSLIQETGGAGPEGILNHARNLTFINLKTGSVKKVFDQKVYIWDFFRGKFSIKKKSINRGELSEDTLNIEDRFIIIAVVEDTNKDKFLNNRDYKKIYLYDPYKENLVSVLPEEYYFEKIVYNSKKNQLVLIVSKQAKDDKENHYAVFVYDVVLSEGRIIQSDNQIMNENPNKKEEDDEQSLSVPSRP